MAPRIHNQISADPAAIQLAKPAGFLKTILTVELIHSAAGSHCLLLSCVERMACRTNLHMNIRLCRACGKGIAAVAGHRRLFVFRMDSFFHLVHLIIIISCPRRFVCFQNSGLILAQWKKECKIYFYFSCIFTRDSFLSSGQISYFSEKRKRICLFSGRKGHFPVNFLVFPVFLCYNRQ